MVPISALVAVGFKCVWELRGRWPRGASVAAALYGLVLVVSIGRSAGQTIEYFAEIDWSYPAMSRDVADVLAEDPTSRGILLGHFSTTMALHADIFPVNDRFAPTTLAERIEEYRPRYLVTESSAFERDWADQWTTVHPDEGGVRLATLREYYGEIELIRTYDVFDNYQGWPVSFYRLHPKPELGWHEGDDPLPMRR
jgi:hypothetical protein